MPKRISAHSLDERCLEEHSLRIAGRNASAGCVDAVVCRFCEAHGRKERPGKKRKRTTNIKHYKTPFRTDHFKQHLRGQHTNRWSQRRLMQGDRSQFFSASSSVSKDVERWKREDVLAFWFDKKAVEVIVAEILADPEENEAGERALSAFQREGDGSNTRGSGPDQELAETERINDRGGCFAQVKNKRQFQLVIDYVACGSSFRHASRVLASTTRRTGLADLAGRNEKKVRAFARIACAANLQKTSDVLANCWAFSIAADASANYNTSHLDVRMRFCVGHELRNAHLVAIPMLDSHTVLRMRELFCKVMGSLTTNWRKRLIGVSADGAPSALGHRQGFSARAERESCGGFCKVWCASHQLNLVAQSAIEELHENMFINSLNYLIGCLRRQQRLIEEIGSSCPRHASAR